ncbi:hypothetical protein P8907_19875 [Bacillus atrophaeus]|uniref:hypothetical protein n=1 Tax=Bacillus atrophaeus TaxID=1452 RepID=UPI002282FBEF|nr:hypothetical protein [Bacillus atrophaeus]MCY8911058.1 hypothetical protein [Bacillus atrophaeus]MEC0836359.1 hypothetical protein [Bacillus atrophaeus]MEC0846591.1 hypothetical protein [Bacillus atrophaeus]MEC0850889.1 hypothetical protein [Bacillus atrophaeus]MEC0867635.1 hypothetical protein [Bacillus atrophaeus]
MELIAEEFYADDHIREDSIIETIVMQIISKRNSSIGEVESDFYVTETMQLVDGNFESIYKNDWLPQFLKRKATESEVELFKYHRGLNGDLKHWAEFIRE